LRRKIIVNNKEYTAQKLSIDDYMEYTDLAEKIEEGVQKRSGNRYNKEELESMMLYICKLYGNQFTVEELRDRETGLDAAGIILEFSMVEMGVSTEINNRVKGILENFTNGK
jgi:hypothetical protein